MEDTEYQTTVDKVYEWRVLALESMGFDSLDARHLAEDKSVELRRVERALSLGCSVLQAVRIFG